MRRYIPIISLLLGGCALAEPYLQTGREVTDQALQGAERFMCRIAPVGPVMDRYFSSKEKYEAWRTICAKDPDPGIEPPPQ